ncbi:hypothetical protein N781_04160 [Pontibacillus halophilus JSM 076056 = DSM 19796]|uniref:Uncharacterized protein n=1 Tax=Pontibacillus halophilus JSM 076056 = DSM 19796 TaxID=1385510 RepID=A0A0A5I6D1_9BACI|nr:hypothetical protein N781_04160 [Pontibacillus halophilus JSM 076056 = DSM 19796]
MRACPNVKRVHRPRSSSAYSQVTAIADLDVQDQGLPSTVPMLVAKHTMNVIESMEGLAYVI